MRRTSLMLALVALLATSAFAKPATNAHAANYGKWAVQSRSAVTAASGQVMTFDPSTCMQAADTATFFIFSHTYGYAPVIVTDAISTTETVTPSAVYFDGATCSITATFSYAHAAGVIVTSGTSGLQEALNGSLGGILEITPDFKGSISSLYSSAAGSTSIPILDTTVVPYGIYTWSGSAYTVNPQTSYSLVTANGASIVYGSNSENVTLGGTTSTDSTTNLLPANSVIDAVVARVTTTIVTTTAWELGDATTAARFSGSQTSGQLTAGATLVGGPFAVGTGLASSTTGAWQTSAAKVRITQTGTPSAGAIRITVFYHTFVAPTS